MSVLVRLLSLLRTLFRRLAVSVRWLARKTYQQRSLGVASLAEPQLVRLLDLHALTIAADVALVAALVVAPVNAVPLLWLIAAIVLAGLTVVGVLFAGRIAVGLLIAAQGIGAVLVAQWVTSQWQFVPVLLAMAVAQQVAVVVVWVRQGAPLIGLARATAYGLLLGVFAGGGGLAAGLFFPATPLWIAAVLFTIAALLVMRMPSAPQRPAKIPAQGKVPQGYAVYRPSSLDDPS